MTHEHDNHPWAQNPPPRFLRDIIKEEGRVFEESEYGQLVITYEGPCPCCLGPTVSTTPLSVIPIDDQGIRGQSAGEPFYVTVDCACSTAHPDTPPGKHGCGHQWEVKVR